MPREYVRAIDLDTNSEVSVFPSELHHGNYEVVDAPAVDTNGDPLPGRRLDAPEEPTGYEIHTVPDLRAEIERRNLDLPEDAQIPSQGNKPDLIAALVADDNKEK